MRQVFSFLLALSFSTVSFAQARGYATSGIDSARIEAARIAHYRQIQQEKDLLHEAKREAQRARWKRNAFIIVPAVVLAAIGYKYYKAADPVKQGVNSRATGFFGWLKNPKAAEEAVQAAAKAAGEVGEEGVIYGGETAAAAAARDEALEAGATLGGATSAAANDTAAGLQAAADAAKESTGEALKGSTETFGDSIKGAAETIKDETKRAGARVAESVSASIGTFRTRLPRGGDAAAMVFASGGTIGALVYDRELDRFESEIDRALARLDLLERDLDVLQVLSDVTSR